MDMSIFSICSSVRKRIKDKVNEMARCAMLEKQKKQFQNTSLSVFSSNCVGCVMLHDLGLRFNSPLVNLYMSAKDYIKFLQDPQGYCDMEFQEKETDLNYPVAMLGDLTLHFVHYESYAEAVEAFKKRAKRINYDNLFVIFSERDGCTYEDLKVFDSLPYENKVVFTAHPYEEIRSAFYMEGFEGELGNILDWDRKIGHKIYDRFPFAAWFDGRGSRKEENL